jgi:hypothetical protein
MDALLPPLRGGQVTGADGSDLLLERLQVSRLGIEPVALAMRLEFGRLLKNNRPKRHQTGLVGQAVAETGFKRVSPNA